MSNLYLLMVLGDSFLKLNQKNYMGCLLCVLLVKSCILILEVLHLKVHVH